MYVGVRRFAKLLQIKSVWMSGWFYALICLSAAIGIAVVPLQTPDPVYSPLMYDVLHAIGVVESLSYLAVAVLLWSIRANASIAYHRALGWFWLMAALQAIMHSTFIASDYVWRDSLVVLSAVLLLVSYFAQLMTGYAFYRMSLGDEPAETVDNTDTTLVDVIVYVASLASKPGEIDLILDSLRRITAMDHGAQPAYTQNERRILEQTYRQLEDYLTTKEPLRAFSRDSLRSLVEERFGRLPFLAGA